MRVLYCQNNPIENPDYREVSLEYARKWMQQERCASCVEQRNLDLLGEATTQLGMRIQNDTTAHERYTKSIHYAQESFWLHKEAIDPDLGPIMPPPKPMKAVIEKTYKGEIFKVRIKRTVKGIDLLLKSQFIEDYFKNLSRGDCVDSCLGTKAYRVRDLRTLEKQLDNSLSLGVNVVLSNYGSRSALFSGRRFDVSMLRTVGIGEGLTVSLENQPASKDALEQYARNLQRFVSALYRHEQQALSVEGSVQAENDTARAAIKTTGQPTLV